MKELLEKLTEDLFKPYSAKEYASIVKDKTAALCTAIGTNVETKRWLQR